MDISDFSLPELIERKDHLNILRYIRTHKLRKPDLVLQSAYALLGPNLDKKSLSFLSNDDIARLSILEQTCLAALDAGQPTVADTCLNTLTKAGIAKTSTRFRLLLARCLEYSGNMGEAKKIYEECLTENPANVAALQRMVCLAQDDPVAQTTALHTYLGQQWGDTSAWYQLAQNHKEHGDWAAAAYCLEHVVVGTAAGAMDARVELAECYATAGDWLLARQTMAAAVEQDPTHVRAWMGLLSIANMYVVEKGTGKNVDELELQVAEELVKLGAEKVLALYKGNKSMFPAVKKLMAEYTAKE